MNSLDELPRGNNETVLVAEDDALLRTLAATVLGEFGYNVIAASDGQDAVDKFSCNKDAVRLVILDMMMPNKNGKEVYEFIRSIKPEIRVLFASGYASDVFENKEMPDSHCDFVMKPISPTDLLRKVRRMLDQ